MSTTTAHLFPVPDLRAAVSRHAARLKEMFRRSFSLTFRERPQSEYVRALKKSVLSSDRCKAVELVVTMVIDLAQRGTLEECESIGQALVAIARSEHAAVHPDGTRVQLSREEASLAEQCAQGIRENAEKAMDLFPSLGNRLKFLAASNDYHRAARALDEAVQREVAAL